MKPATKRVFITLLKIYNIIAMIIGHIVILGGVVFGIYMIYVKDMLNQVLIGIIILLLIILTVSMIHNKILKRRLKK